MTRWDRTDELAANCFSFIHNKGKVNALQIRRWRTEAREDSGFRNRWRDAVMNARSPEEMYARSFGNTDSTVFYRAIKYWHIKSKLVKQRWLTAFVACVISKNKRGL